MVTVANARYSNMVVQFLLHEFSQNHSWKISTESPRLSDLRYFIKIECFSVSPMKIWLTSEKFLLRLLRQITGIEKIKMVLEINFLLFRNHHKCPEMNDKIAAIISNNIYKNRALYFNKFQVPFFTHLMLNTCRSKHKPNSVVAVDGRSYFCGRHMQKNFQLYEITEFGSSGLLNYGVLSHKNLIICT